jgi:predicted regulator of Ras-like GTPase activity (Roadblock/LC7/MglB family)
VIWLAYLNSSIRISGSLTVRWRNCSKSESSAALLLDKGGFLITQCGRVDQFDSTSLAALSAGSYAATETIASMVQESTFSSVYQQGETHSILVLNVDEHCLLTVIFPARISVGAVKYYAVDTAKLVASQMQAAAARNPSVRIDLSMLNLADPQPLFRKNVA